MVDLTRRKTVLGMGLLASGSGAALTSAAFSNNVSPSSDMRVAVGEQLIVEPGILFRDGNSPDDTFDPSAVGTGPNQENLSDNGNGNGIFGGNNNSGLENISYDDVPAASANDDMNDNLSLEVATRLDADDVIGNAQDGFIQIRNDTSTDQDVAIRFDAFGPDTDGALSSNNGDVSESDVVDIYKFRNSSNEKISSNDVGATVSDQTVANTVTVTAGTVEQVYLDYNTSIAESNIKTAATSGSPFNNQTGTTDLVDTLSVGTDPNNTA